MVTDEGQGFQPDAVADPTVAQNLMSSHGRGLFLIRKFKGRRGISSGGSPDRTAENRCICSLNFVSHFWGSLQVAGTVRHWNKLRIDAFPQLVIGRQAVTLCARVTNHYLADPIKQGVMAKQATQPAAKSLNEPTLSSASSPRADAQEIAKLANQLWQARGCPEGSSEDDWLEAERQLQGRS